MSHRPTTAQFALGVFTVVAATVALLAATGVSGVPGVAAVVLFALALGTLVAVLAAPAPHAADRRAEHRTPVGGHE
ncbi:hypothetical protein ACIPYS_37265 [Kitasatospora sp. NPDC089913]|uniref:hypothetical protein n=1 Tax=Streptomycetaceae TaxID=2062 RepID=UPI00087C7B03|nr:hypothetical protein [Streptomyces sp. TLI_053]SDT75695.1 hypothetical protein SAMN05216371_5008 [Streptomyces sp. TLI_053]